MTSTPTGRYAGRALGTATAVMGGASLLWPHALAKRFSGGRSTPDNAVVRVLGGRQLLQGTAQMVRPVRDVILVGIVVDVVHVFSMLVLSVVWPQYRRSTLTSATIATLSAAAGTAVVMTDRG